MESKHRSIVAGAGIFLAAIGFRLAVPAASAAEKAARIIDYNRDIRPIFSQNCYACHGPDAGKRKAGLRLDVKESAFKKLESGKVAIIARDPKQSELIRRLTTTDEDDKMPPAKSGKHLTAAQIDLLGRWVEQGAKWDAHWAYIKPERPPLPTVRQKAWVRNAIDYFILARLEAEGLKPSSEAGKAKLIRRLTLDLTGLPPTLKEVDDFLADKRPEAYEKLVERLLNTPQYGERMAQFWLDLARFADTNGYHIDNHRDIWKWRDWVINAFNHNLPFDQFTLEQLAGDLLPNPTLEQKIATGFNRNEMVNFEGGADENEYLTKYIVGRIDTTSKVWLGTTFACAECHDHKYDPISQKDFYQFYAFFNHIAEKGLDGNVESPAPRLSLATPEQTAQVEKQTKEIGAVEAGLKSLLEAPNAEQNKAQAEWVQQLRKNVATNWAVPTPLSFASTAGATLIHLPDDSILASGANADQDTYEIVLKTALNEITGLRLEALTHASLPTNGPGRGEKGNFVLTKIEAEAKSADPEKQPKDLPPPLLGNWYAIGPFKAASTKESFEKAFPPEQEITLSKEYTDDKLRWTEQTNWQDGVIHELKGTRSANYVYRTITAKEPVALLVSLGSGDGLQVWLNGKKLLAHEVTRQTAPDQEKLRLKLEKGENKLLMKINNRDGEFGFYFRALEGPVIEYPVALGAAAADFNQNDFNVGGALDDDAGSGWAVGEKGVDRQAFFLARQPFGFAEGTEIKVRLKFESKSKQHALGRFRLGVTTADGLTEFFGFPDNVRSSLVAADDQLTAEQKLELQKYYRRKFVPEVATLEQVLNGHREEKKKVENAIVKTMVMAEQEKPRDTYILVRGDFRNKGEQVAPGVPRSILPRPEGAVSNRLALAQWLVDPDNPLVARVTVNRYWQQYFGSGLVKTSDDFGSQGEWPSHPELLDWLATEFIRTRWDIRAMQKLIVMSATYRQDATVDKAVYDRDPDNRLLARGPRQRLEAEAIRDNALAVSGLLNQRIGGPSVLPYQPPGLWEQVAFGGGFSSQEYKQSKGDENYRRGLYTYWKRSMPYASFAVFDAPNREVCTVRRPRTNTPLQALVLLNDPVYVEAARALGQRIMREGGGQFEARMRFAFKLCLARPPMPNEMNVLERIYTGQLKNFREDTEAAKKLIQAGESKPASDLDPGELAAWTAIGNVLLNLDETITKG